MTWFRVSGGEMHGAEINGIAFDDALINNVIELRKDGELIKSSIVTVDKTFKFSGIQKAGMYLISTKDTPMAKKMFNVTYKNIVEKEKVETTLSTFYVTAIFEFKDEDFSKQKVKLYKEDDFYEELIVSDDNTLTVFLNEEGLYKLKFGEEFQYEKHVTATNEEMYSNVEKIIETHPVHIVTWADGTDYEISLMIQAHYEGVLKLSDYWSVGDVRESNLSAVSGVEAQKIELMIIGFDHDDKADGSGKAALTINQRDSSGYGKMNETNTNKGGWEKCRIRSWCNLSYMQALPPFIANLIKPVVKHTASGNDTYATIDNVFLLSEAELGYTKNSIEGEGFRYEYFNSANSRCKYADSSRKTSVYWWERSPRKDTTTEFCRVSPVGTFDYEPASSSHAVVPAFCF